MKRFVLALCFALLAVPSAFAYDPCEECAQFVKSGANVQTVAVLEYREDPLLIIDGGGWTDLGRLIPVGPSPVGVSWYFHVTSGWAEVHGGPTFRLTENVTVGVDAGVETEPDDTFRFRYALSLSAESGPWRFVGSVEHNTGLFDGDQSGLWYDLNGLINDPRYQPWVFGLKWRSDIGVGPYCEVTLPGDRFKVWAAWTKIDPEHLDRGIDWSRFMLGSVVQF